VSQSENKQENEVMEKASGGQITNDMPHLFNRVRMRVRVMVMRMRVMMIVRARIR
jgi:hypothetical protein